MGVATQPKETRGTLTPVTICLISIIDTSGSVRAGRGVTFIEINLTQCTLCVIRMITVMLTIFPMLDVDMHTHLVIRRTQIHTHVVLYRKEGWTFASESIDQIEASGSILAGLVQALINVILTGPAIVARSTCAVKTIN